MYYYMVEIPEMLLLTHHSCLLSDHLTDIALCYVIANITVHYQPSVAFLFPIRMFDHNLRALFFDL
jgi:hypothetical protein